ncbi:hypothetical protein V1525DRAFT_399317 [Lipomyces kononenkoae]|uniref:Uncharacterized protein n=1 Tax=Lipomyces kononenkoae TaxID=34357 RepID=A0ACC3T5B9_LIPKO
MSRKGTPLDSNKTKKSNDHLPQTLDTPSPASAKGFSSKLLTMKFMRQAAAKEKLAELEEQQRQVDDASKWKLPDDRTSSNGVGVTPSRLKIVQGVGFHVIDSSSEDLPALAGRRSWGRFNEQFDDGNKGESDESSCEDDDDKEEIEDPEEMRKRRRREQEEDKNMILHARMSKSVSGAGTPSRVPKRKRDKSDTKKPVAKDAKKEPASRKNFGGDGQTTKKKQKKAQADRTR